MDANQLQAFKALVLGIEGQLTAELRARAAAIKSLAHYTSFDALSAIVRSNELWFSCVRDMTDTEEVTAGAAMVANALDEIGPRIFKTVAYDKLRVREQFATLRTTLEAETYAFSLSEHAQNGEADRLVMWTGYGNHGQGICAVFNGQAMLGQNAQGKFAVHWTPMVYEKGEILKNRVEKLLAMVEEASRSHPEFTNHVDPSLLGRVVAFCAVTYVVRLKNCCFDYEHEVRFVRSNLLQIEPLPPGAGFREVAKGAGSKRVFVLPLRNYPEYGVKAALAEMMDHVIIGPSHEQDVIAADVRRLFDDNGLQHVEVKLSEIPYRYSR
jgi:hypothetical protein